MELAVMCRYALCVWLTLMAGSNPSPAAYKYVNPWSPPFPASNLISFRDKLKYKFSLPRLRSKVKHKLDQSEDQFLQFRQKLKDKLVPQTPIRKQLTLPELPQITPNDIRTRILGLVPDSVTPSEFFSLVGVSWSLARQGKDIFNFWYAIFLLECCDCNYTWCWIPRNVYWIGFSK